MYGPMTVPTRYRTQDIKWLRKKYKPGTILEITRLRVDGEEMIDPRKAKKERIKVVKTFPHIVSCVDESGFRRTFGYFDLEEQAKIIR